jgi:prevent-host-death family protein
MKLGLREANQQFSKAIRAVRAGKEVLLTERGQPIAIIKPLSDAHEPDAALARMADEGLIQLPSRKGPLPGFRPVPNRREPVSRTIIDEREDRA